MSRLWLVSYPKSGNTWFRMLAGALAATDERPLDINRLPEKTRLPSTREHFDHATMIETALLTHDEGERLRAALSAQIFRPLDRRVPAPVPLLFKIHDAYTRTDDGRPVLGEAPPAGAVVLVRDPRDVAISLAAHFNSTVDFAIGFMGRRGAMMGGMPDDRTSHFRQRLLTWEEHVASWLDQTDVPVHLVRYEDLLGHTAEVFRGAMLFAGFPVTSRQAERAADLASFTTLQAQERERGFVEGFRHGPFFRSGRSGGWKAGLTDAQVARIEADQARGMARFGYQPADP